jgi:hypothetical protein
VTALSSWSVDPGPAAVVRWCRRSGGEWSTSADSEPNMRLNGKTAALHHSDTSPQNFRRFRVDLKQFIAGTRKNADIHMTCG